MFEILEEVVPLRRPPSCPVPLPTATLQHVKLRFVVSSLAVLSSQCCLAVLNINVEGFGC
jgi:hypothetical protein